MLLWNMINNSIALHITFSHGEKTLTNSTLPTLKLVLNLLSSEEWVHCLLYSLRLSPRLEEKKTSAQTKKIILEPTANCVSWK